MDNILQLMFGFVAILFMAAFIFVWRPDDGVLVIFIWAAFCLLLALLPMRAARWKARRKL